MYDFNNSLNWDLVLRQSYDVIPVPVPPGANYTEYRPIPDISRVVDSRILAIGTNCNHAKPWWSWGGNASMRLLTLPSSTSDYVAAVEAETKKCKLFSLTLMIFPDLGVSSYLLNLEVPYYFKQFSCEIWKYSGPVPVAAVGISNDVVEINLDG